jgi:hypothetical protein
MNLDESRLLLGQVRDAIDLVLGPRAAPPPPPTNVVRVPAGQSLQSAMDAAPSGTSLQLDDGASYVGNVLCPPDKALVISGTAALPPGRVTPARAAGFPKLVQVPGGLPAINYARGAHHVAFTGVEVAGIGGGDLITTGDMPTSLDGIPENLLFDRVYVHGDPVLGQKRGLHLNGKQVLVACSHFDDFKVKGQDAQAVAGSYGPGPFQVLDCHLSGAGENAIFGGSDPRISGMVPSDILFRGCLFTKPWAWWDEGWQIKNLFELKNARRVVVEDCVFEHMKKSAASPDTYAVWLTVRNQEGNAPWSTIEHVAFRRNTLRQVGCGITLLATDYSHPSGLMTDVRIEDNRIEDLNPVAYGGSGRTFAIHGGPVDLQIRGNKVDGPNGAHSFLQFSPSGAPGADDHSVRLVVENNDALEGDYGIFGDGAPGMGKVALDHYAQDYVWRNNRLRRGSSGRVIAYPASTELV